MSSLFSQIRQTEDTNEDFIYVRPGQFKIGDIINHKEQIGNKITTIVATVYATFDSLTFSAHDGEQVHIVAAAFITDISYKSVRLSVPTPDQIR